ncbi:MAG: hypothetical protein ABR572_12030 [Cryomorphaceae bacterium]
MKNEKLLQNLRDIIDHAPDDWKYLTTHRLDIYNEEAAKTEFLEAFEKVIEKGISDTAELNELPTAYDYIRLGHPLSSVLEWARRRMSSVSLRALYLFWLF